MSFTVPICYKFFSIFSLYTCVSHFPYLSQFTLHVIRTIRNLPAGIRHSIWGVLDAAVYPAIYLLLVPMLWKYMGNTVFGLWILLNSLITILQLFNFNSGVANLGLVIIRNLAYARANKDEPYARNTINAVLIITTALFLIISLTGFALSDLAVRSAWWGLGLVTGVNTWLCIILAVVFAGMKYFDQVFQTIIKACEEFRLASVLNMMNRFGLLGITLIMAMKHYGLAKIIAANIIYLAIYLCFQFYWIYKIVPGYHAAIVHDRNSYKRVFSFSLLPWVQALVIVLTFQTDRFWVSASAGLTEVSGYGLASTIFNHVHMIFTAMAVWVLPRISLIHSHGKDPSKLYNTVRNILLAVIIISLMFFYFLAPFVIREWIGPERYLQMLTYTRAFAAFEMLFAYSILPFLYLNAVGKEWLATKLTLFYCCICYGAMLAGLKIFDDPKFMIAGMTLSLCFTMPVVNFFAHRSLDVQYRWWLAWIEMLPVFLAVALFYWEGNAAVHILGMLFILFLVLKNYGVELLNKNLWKQLPGI
jgi:O-antigen/teichoic acid export membrane protein